MEMTENEICRDYHWAVDKVNQILILSELNLVSQQEIKDILVRGGEILPKNTRTHRVVFGKTIISDKRKRQLRQYAREYRNKHLEECRDRSREYQRKHGAEIRGSEKYKKYKKEYDHARYVARKAAQNAEIST